MKAKNHLSSGKGNFVTTNVSLSHSFGILCFTLLELLICVAIVFCLAALSAPALVGIKDKAKAVQCASNLRQIGIAINLYGVEKGTYPNTHHPVSFSGDSEWSYLISRYLGKPDASSSKGRNSRSPVLECPASAKTPAAFLKCTYSMVSAGGVSNLNERLRYPYIHRPSQVIMVTDADQDISSGSGESKSDYTVCSPDISQQFNPLTANQVVNVGDNADNIGPSDAAGEIRFRHNDNSLANVLFFDGHVGTVKTNQVLQQCVLLGE